MNRTELTGSEAAIDSVVLTLLLLSEKKRIFSCTNDFVRSISFEVEVEVEAKEEVLAH